MGKVFVTLGHTLYPYRAHTAEEPVGDGPRGRCYGPVNQCHIRCDMGGKGVKFGLTVTAYDFYSTPAPGSGICIRYA